MRLHRLIVCIFAAAALVGCSGPVRKDAVPENLTTQAVVPGLEDVRYRVGMDTDKLARDAIDAFWREMAHLEATGHSGPLPPATFLAVSGGGDNGAFGAGLHAVVAFSTSATLEVVSELTT